MAALASDWLRHFLLLLWNRWMEFNETGQEARSQRPLPSLCFSGRSEKTRWPPWLLIGWDIFDFSSETAERNSTKLDRKQDLNVFYQVAYWADQSTKMFPLADSSKRWQIVLRCTICGPLGLLFIFIFYFFRTSDRYHDHHAWSRHRESWCFYWLMKSLTAFLVLNWSFGALVSLLIVQTLAKFQHKHTPPWRFPPAFPPINSDTIKSRDVTIIDINRLSVTKAFRFSIIDSQISLSIVFYIDNIWKLCVISLVSK